MDEFIKNQEEFYEQEHQYFENLVDEFGKIVFSKGKNRMKILKREEILKIDDIKTEEVLVPEWGAGVGVLVRGLNGAERDRFEGSILDQSGKKTKVNMQNARARLVQMSTVDEDGKLIFSAADVLALGSKNAAALDRIFDVASRLSGISEDDMEELVKNSEAILSESSTSD
jgi:hypothetical protein